MEYTYHYPSPLGGIRLTSDGESLTGLRFAENVPAVQTELPVFAAAETWLNGYFGGHAPEETPPIRITNATPFQRAVWDMLPAIPYGKTVTYGEMARRLAEQFRIP